MLSFTGDQQYHFYTCEDIQFRHRCCEFTDIPRRLLHDVKHWELTDKSVHYYMCSCVCIIIMTPQRGGAI